jgi:hypothetical protein
MIANGAFVTHAWISPNSETVMKTLIVSFALSLLSHNTIHAAVVVDTTGSDPIPTGYYPVTLTDSVSVEYSVRQQSPLWIPLPHSSFFLPGDQSLNLDSFTFELLHNNQYYTQHEIALEYWLGEPATIHPMERVGSSQRFIYTSDGSREVLLPITTIPEPLTIYFAVLTLITLIVISRRIKS